MKMPFGKFKNEELDDIPTSYLTWLLTETEVDKTNPALAAECQNQLDAREGKGIDRKGFRSE